MLINGDRAHGSGLKQSSTSACADLLVFAKSQLIFRFYTSQGLSPDRESGAEDHYPVALTSSAHRWVQCKGCGMVKGVPGLDLDFEKNTESCE